MNIALNEALGRDRPFDPAKLPKSDSAKQLVVEALAWVSKLERRQRARREVDQANHEGMVAALVLDLAHRAITAPNEWLSVSLQKPQYSLKRRRAPFLTESFPTLVKLLATDGDFVELRQGFQAPFGASRRTTIRAGSGLRRRIKVTGLSLADIGRNQSLRGDVLVLRGPKVRGTACNLPIPETDQTKALRAEVEAINDWIASADLVWGGRDDVDVGDRFLRRIFNNGSFELGGRLFGGFWQRASSEDRLESLFFEDHPAVALDFAQMAARSAYSEVGAEPPKGDLYEVSGLEGHRDGVKRVLNALLASDGVPRRFPQGTRKLFSRKWKFADVLSLISARHPRIQHLFGTGLALRLMYLESRLLMAILGRLRELKVVALPIHDCLLVSQEHSAVAKQVMEEAFKELLGLEGRVEESLPCLITSTSDYPLSSVRPVVPLKRGA